MALDRFARLRELLHKPPSPAHWMRLLELFSSWPRGEEKALALDYADAHLDGWEPELRSSPLVQLWPQFPRSKPEARWRLLRGLRLSFQELTRVPLFQSRPLRLPEGAMEQIRFLAIRDSNFGVHECVGLLDALQLTGLNALQARDLQIRGPELRELCEHPQFASIQQLDLEHNLLSDEGLLVLLDAIGARPFTRLNLCANGLGEEGVKALIDAPLLGTLTHLDLGRNPEIPSPLLVDLLDALDAGQLHSLSLDSMRFRDEDLLAIVEHPHLAGLKKLGLSRVGLGRVEGLMERLAEAPLAQDLEEIDLSHNQIREADALTLSRSPHFQLLRSLRIQHNPIGARGILAVSSRKHFPALQEVILEGIVS